MPTSDNEIIDWYKKRFKGFKPSGLMASFFSFRCGCCEETIHKHQSFSFIGERGDSDKICELCSQVINDFLTDNYQDSLAKKIINGSPDLLNEEQKNYD